MNNYDNNYCLTIMDHNNYFWGSGTGMVGTSHNYFQGSLGLNAIIACHYLNLQGIPILS